MPVYRLLDEMPYDEMLKWFDYLSKRPAGWRDDDRTYKLLQAQGVKEPAPAIFPSLKVIYNPPQTEEAKRSKLAASLKSSPMFSRILAAKGGITLKE